MAEPLMTSVTVVGAGPVGLTVAWLLARQGVDVTVLEAGPALNRELRASTFHPVTLDLLEPTGLTADMVAQGLVADLVRYFDRQSGLVAEFDHRLIADVTRHPFRLQLEQYKYSQLLFERLQREPSAAVRFGCEVLSVRTAAGGATAVVSDGGSARELEADFLVGADGARGTVRKSLGLDFTGWTYEQRFLLMSTDLPLERLVPGLCHVNYMSDPDEFLMLLRIPDVWRILVPVDSDEAEDELTTPQGLTSVMSRVVPAGTNLSSHMLGYQLYRVHQRVAERLRVGRVLLAGDAGHVNSPMGGFGLNSGIHDAIDLCARIQRIIRAGSPTAVVDAELGAYESSRRAVALDHVRAMSHRNTTMLTERDPVKRKALIEDFRATAADTQRAREFLLDAAMVTSAIEARIGAPPA
jgi:3-(3-hydroxy-phenyl)propionate hydroxylase